MASNAAPDGLGFAEVLRRIRKEVGFDLTALKNLSGVSPERLAQFEAGTLPPPRAIEFYDALVELGVSKDQLTELWETTDAPPWLSKRLDGKRQGQEVEIRLEVPGLNKEEIDKLIDGFKEILENRANSSPSPQSLN